MNARVEQQKVSDTEIELLRVTAEAAGDEAQVRICEIALGRLDVATRALVVAARVQCAREVVTRKEPGVPFGCVEAGPFVARSLGRTLRLMREESGLSRAELAKKLKKSEAFVAAVEEGLRRVGRAYFASAERVCLAGLKDVGASANGNRVEKETPP